MTQDPSDENGDRVGVLMVRSVDVWQNCQRISVWKRAVFYF